MADPRRNRRYRYRAWHGGPDPLAPPYDVRKAPDALGEEVLAGGGPRDALREMLRRGLRDAPRRGRLDGAVTRAQAQLDQALAAEREALAARDTDDARFAEAQLDNLPRSTAAAVQELSEYRWTSPEAERIYRDILDGLRSDVLDQRFRGMRDALQGMQPGASSPEQQAANQRLKDMLSDLNQLLDKHARGEDTQQDFDEFMGRHGDLFPGDPQNVDELVDELARQAASAERLMASLTPQQREELAGLMAQALGDPDLAAQMAALNDNLRALRPDLTWDRGERMRGDQPLGYGEAAGALGELSDLDDLIDQLGQEHPGATLDDVDVETVERALGSSAAQDVRALRRLGQTALRKVFEHLKDGGRGEHNLHDAGAAGEFTGASREWRFGDEQPLDVVRTVSNGVRRSASRPSQ